jgi:hypothetical protein
MPLFGKRFELTQSSCEVPPFGSSKSFLKISTPPLSRTSQKYGKGEAENG